MLDDELKNLADSTEKNILSKINESEEFLSDKIKKISEEVEDKIGQL